jgi:hypothetical protein
MALYNTDYDGLYIDPDNFERIVSDESPDASFKLNFISSDGNSSRTARLKYYIIENDLFVLYEGEEKRTYISNISAYSKSSIRKEFNKFYHIEKYNGVGDDIKVEKGNEKILMSKDFPIYIRRSFDTECFTSD